MGSYVLFGIPRFQGNPRLEIFKVIRKSRIAMMGTDAGRVKIFLQNVEGTLAALFPEKGILNDQINIDITKKHAE